MLRRSHRKSRGGCLECKRRHVKCDENRPRCRLCTVSDRECNFASLSNPDARSQSVSPGAQYRQTAATAQSEAPPSTPIPCNWLPTDDRSIDDRHPHCEEHVNAGHMELLVHAMLNEDMYNFAIGFEKLHRTSLALGFEAALKAPYLMHQVLAFSACHLAHINPDRSGYFSHQAVTLQTRAVSIFNMARVDVDQSNCVPILLFSSMLGQHLLADTLAAHPSTGIEGFITHYVQCIEMHRGIYTIATSAWPLLMKSELEPVLSMSRNFTSQPPKGDDCSMIDNLIDHTDDMSEEEKHACRTAVRYLQVGLDALQRDEDSPISRYQMICEWTMLIPPTFTRLLAAKQPVALIVLAHYAILLHSGRHMWQVGDAGSHILVLIEAYLGPRWKTWLSYPRARIADPVLGESQVQLQDRSGTGRIPPL